MLENNQRVPTADIEPIFVDRWSPRSFDKEFTISDDQIESLVEAARWSPSSFNDQPWRFVVSKRGSASFDDFVELLFDSNKKWAKDASAIAFLAAKKISDTTKEINPMAEFDSGAAWMSLTLQARADNLYTHGMGGIYKDMAYDKLGISRDDYKIICAFAIGKKGQPSKLPDNLQKEEKVNDRKEVEKILFYDSFKTEH